MSDAFLLKGLYAHRLPTCSALARFCCWRCLAASTTGSVQDGRWQAGPMAQA
jgi:hypothetical protein